MLRRSLAPMAARLRARRALRLIAWAAVIAVPAWAWAWSGRSHGPAMIEVGIGVELAALALGVLWPLPLERIARAADREMGLPALCDTAVHLSLAPGAQSALVLEDAVAALATKPAPPWALVWPWRHIAAAIALGIAVLLWPSLTATNESSAPPRHEDRTAVISPPPIPASVPLPPPRWVPPSEPRHSSASPPATPPPPAELPKSVEPPPDTNSKAPDDLPSFEEALAILGAPELSDLVTNLDRHIDATFSMGDVIGASTRKKVERAAGSPWGETGDEPPPNIANQSDPVGPTQAAGMAPHFPGAKQDQRQEGLESTQKFANEMRKRTAIDQDEMQDLLRQSYNDFLKAYSEKLKDRLETEIRKFAAEKKQQEGGQSDLSMPGTSEATGNQEPPADSANSAIHEGGPTIQAKTPQGGQLSARESEAGGVGSTSPGGRGAGQSNSDGAGTGAGDTRDAEGGQERIDGAFDPEGLGPKQADDLFADMASRSVAGNGAEHFDQAYSPYFAEAERTLREEPVSPELGALVQAYLGALQPTEQP